VSAATKCKFQKPDGTSCMATSTPSGFCWFHDPDREQERAEARRKGGGRRRQQAMRTVLSIASTEDVPLADVADVVRALAETFKQVRKGQLDPKTGNCLGLLAGQLLKALQEGEVSAEMEAQSIEMKRLRCEIEEVRRERRHAKNAAPATANGAGSHASSHGEQSHTGRDQGGWRGDPETGGDDGGFLAADATPFFS
jgi:hypothetical protein